MGTTTGFDRERFRRRDRGAPIIAECRRCVTQSIYREVAGLHGAGLRAGRVRVDHYDDSALRCRTVKRSRGQADVDRLHHAENLWVGYRVGLSQPGTWRLRLNLMIRAMRRERAGGSSAWIVPPRSTRPMGVRTVQLILPPLATLMFRTSGIVMATLDSVPGLLYPPARRSAVRRGQLCQSRQGCGSSVFDEVGTSVAALLALTVCGTASCLKAGPGLVHGLRVDDMATARSRRIDVATAESLRGRAARGSGPGRIPAADTILFMSCTSRAFAITPGRTGVAAWHLRRARTSGVSIIRSLGVTTLSLLPVHYFR